MTEQQELAPRRKMVARAVSRERLGAAWRGHVVGICNELPRLRSGFRLRAQTPAERLNFELVLTPAGRLHSAQEDRCRRNAFREKSNFNSDLSAGAEAQFVKRLNGTSKLVP